MDNKEQKHKYIPPKIEMIQIELEQSMAAGSANINSGSQNSSQTPSERTFEPGWSNNKDYDI
jgi:hypothetical protein